MLFFFFLVTPCLSVAVQPCMGWIPTKKKNCFWIFVSWFSSAYSDWILPISICFIKYFCEIILCWSEEKVNHVLKTDSVKLFNNLLTNKIFSKQILSWNFKMKFCLNRGLVWELLGWKLIIPTAFFCKITIR